MTGVGGLLVGSMATVVVAGGCARVSVTRLTDGRDTQTEGLRFYRPYPYLQVSEAKGDQAGKGVLEYKVIWLPDLSQEYVMQVRAGLGNAEFKPTLQDGWNLVAMDAKVDSKTAEIIQAAGGLIEKGAKLFTGTKAPTAPVAPGIYRFIFDLNPTLPDGRTPNPTFGKIVGVDADRPVATFEKK
jgi:hypothetical protein